MRAELTNATRQRAKRTYYERPSTAYELRTAHYAYVFGAKPSEVAHWLKACFPGRLRTETPDCLADDVFYVVGTTPDALVLSAYGLDNGFLHEVVAVAVQSGHEAIILEGNGCSGSMWEAFTHFLPGCAPETVCHDPIRGLELTEWPDWLEAFRRKSGAEDVLLLREFYRPKPVNERFDWSLRVAGRTRAQPVRISDHLRIGGVSPTEAWVKLVFSTLFVVMPMLFVAAALLLVGMIRLVDRGPSALTLAIAGAVALAALLGQLPVPLPDGRVLAKTKVIAALAASLVAGVALMYWVTS